VNPNNREINAEAALADPDSVLHHYRALIELRHSEPAVVHGDFTMLLPNDEHVYAFTRRLDDVELLVVGNFSGALVAATIDDVDAWQRAELVVTNVSDARGRDGERMLMLEPWEARVYRRGGGPVDH